MSGHSRLHQPPQLKIRGGLVREEVGANPQFLLWQVLVYFHVCFSLKK